MNDSFDLFQSFVRRAPGLTLKSDRNADATIHPFDERNIHPDITKVTQKLFDDGHYSQATFEAYKYIDKEVAKISKLSKSGYKLMMDAFKEVQPRIHLTNLSSTSEIDEQKGFSFIFAGSVMAIRNPRGHEVGNIDTIEQCLDHLGLASLLLRRLSSRVLP